MLEKIIPVYEQQIVKLIAGSSQQTTSGELWNLDFIENIAGILYTGMESTRQKGREDVLQYAQRTIANAISYSFDVRSIRAESMLRAISFEVAGVENQQLLDILKEALQQALEKGTPWSQFQDAANEAFDKFGVTRLARHHLETVFRNNLQTSYNGGRWDAMQEPVMKAEFPLWEYNAILDDLTRPSHRAMDGKRYPPDDKIWDEWYPPNGHNCRCSVSMVGRDEIEAEKLTADKPPHPTIQPDEGFDTNPAKDLRAIGKWAHEKLTAN